MLKKGFKCDHCSNFVPVSRFMSTAHRNQCPFCLWSKHMDDKPGDRKSKCLGIMEPMGLTFKEEGVDKYGKKRQGELMLVHLCQKCGKICINRIAGDDKPEAILVLFEKSLKMPVEAKNIKLLKASDRQEVKRQLFGD